MIVTASTGTFITLSQAITMGGAWSTAQSAAHNTIDSSNPKAFGFGSEKLLDILNQTDCIGLRLYNGQNTNGKNIIVIGIDSNGDDMSTGLILDMSSVCPPDCGTNSIL